MNLNTSTANSDTVLPMNNSGKSSTPLEATTLKLLPSKSSASTFKKNSPPEKSHSDSAHFIYSSFFLLIVSFCFLTEAITYWLDKFLNQIKIRSEK